MSNPSAFHDAVIDNNLELVKQYLTQGCDPNQPNLTGRNALHLACIRGHTAIAELLIEHKADVNAGVPLVDGFLIIEDLGKNPLHFACENKRPDIVKLLLRHKANPEKTDNNQNTPLHLAAIFGSNQIVATLLKYPIDVFKKNKLEKEPLDLTKDPLIIQLINTKKNEMEAFFLACQKGDVTTLKPLLKHNYAYKKHPSGYYALHFACENGHEEAAKLLLDNGCWVHSETASQSTSLHLAAKNGHDKVVELLIKHNTKINKQDSDGNTALLLACQRNQLTVIALLLKNKADAYIKNNQGKTAVDFSTHPETKKILDHYLADQSSVLVNNFFTAIDTVNIKRVKECIEAGVDVNQKNEYGDNALHSIASNFLIRNNILIQLLIDSEINVNEKNENGSTPLHEFCYWGRVEMIAALIKHGAAVNAINDQGKTPLQIAIPQGNTNVIKLLLDNGADPTILDNQENDALTLANKYNSANGKCITQMVKDAHLRLTQNLASSSSADSVSQPLTADSLRTETLIVKPLQ